MRKSASVMPRLLVLTLLFLLLPFAANAQNGKQHQAQSGKHPSSTAPPPAQGKQSDGTPTSSLPPDHKEEDQPVKIAITKMPDKDGWDKASILIGAVGGILSFGLLIAGIYGVCYARKTLRILTAQTIAGKRAAQAALKQANYMVASERAWVVESINFPDRIPRQPKTGSAGLVVAIVVLKNIGKQPAFLRTAETRFHMAESLPDKPAFRSRKIFEDGYMLYPQQTLLVRVMLEEGSFSDEDADWVEGRRLGGRPPVGLYLYGCIAYDTIGVQGVNSFCYAWANLMGFALEGDKPGFEKKGPKGYNQHT